MDVGKYPVIVEGRAVRRKSREGVCIERGRILRLTSALYSLIDVICNSPQGGHARTGDKQVSPGNLLERK
jgi:hypothetical protein